jgi:hypothetical protein
MIFVNEVGFAKEARSADLIIAWAARPRKGFRYRRALKARENNNDRPLGPNY